MKFHKVFSVLFISLLLNSCSDEDTDQLLNNSSLLVGTWQLISTEDQDGNITDNTSTCYTIEFTETKFFLTDYLDAGCMEAFIEDQGVSYSMIDNYIYWGEVSQDIKNEVMELSETTLIIKGEDIDNGVYYSGISTLRRL